MSNGNPSVSAWAQAIGLIGIPGVIAIFLVYIGAKQVPRIADAQERFALECTANRERLDALVERMQTIERLARRACVNNAPDAAERAVCFQLLPPEPTPK